VCAYVRVGCDGWDGERTKRYRARIEASPGHLSHKKAILLASIEELLSDTFGIDTFDAG